MWLLAKIDKTLRVAANDVVEPYALMANSHDGSMAFNIRLTTVRVVCQNTLALAMRQKIGQHFRRAHQGPFVEHARAAQDFFAATLDELDGIANTFSRLSSCRCSEQKFQDILLRLLPDPSLLSGEEMTAQQAVSPRSSNRLTVGSFHFIPWVMQWPACVRTSQWPPDYSQ